MTRKGQAAATCGHLRQNKEIGASQGQWPLQSDVLTSTKAEAAIPANAPTAHAKSIPARILSR